VEVCIPDIKAKPSFKVQTRVRGFFSIGVQGVGFVAYNPLCASSDKVVVNFSLNTYDSSTVLIGATGTLSEFDYRSPFASTAMRASRLVGAGLRIRYVGTELNKSGSQVGISLAVAGSEEIHNETYSSIASRPDVDPTPVSRGWRSISWIPADDDYTEFGTATTGVYNAISNVNATSKMGFIVEGAAGNKYEFEIVTFREYLSFNNLTVPGTTASHSDMNGISAIRNFIGTVGNFEPGQALYNRGVNYVYQYLLGASSQSLELLGTSLAVGL
jgi:hypothetical protein